MMNKIINKTMLLPVLMTVFLVLQGMRLDASATQEELFPEIEGWEKPSEIDVYTPGTLWDIINGAADVFMAYDFQELYWGEYINKEDNDIYIVMEIYRQGSPINAFGVYSQERPSTPNLIDVGVEGYTAPGVLHFFVSDSYVKIRSHDSSEDTEAAMEKMSRHVSGMLDQNPSFPEITKKLPKEGRVEFSEQYVNMNFMGHTFLSEAFVSSYSIDGNTFNLFVIEKDNSVDIRQMLIDYYEFTDQDVEVTEGRHRIEDRWNGEVGVVWEDNKLYGYYNLENETLKQKYLDLFSD